MSMNGIPASVRSGDSVFMAPRIKNAANEPTRATDFGNNALHITWLLRYQAEAQLISAKEACVE